MLETMGNSIRHRGPDDRGIHVAPGIGLGNQRLSIIDIEGGHQPFASDDGKIVVVQNGEIYNHLELAQDLVQEGCVFRSHCDTEVILRLYERYGIDSVSRLNGMFSIAIYDDNDKALYIIRDRIGVKPLYFFDDGRRFVFASEIKALLKAGIPARMSEEALHHFLKFNYVPPPFTMFKGVTHLLPGHWMRIDRKCTRTERWWDIANAQAVDQSEGDWIEEFNAVLEDAVRLRLRADVEVGAFLSGGVDSSTVVGLMSQQTENPVKTFCIGFDDERFDESVFAQQAADRFSTDHVMERVKSKMINLWPLATYYCDQPHGDVSFLPTYRVSQLASRHLKVVLTGDGGDELFAGYDKYLHYFTDQSRIDGDEQRFRRDYYDRLCLIKQEHEVPLYTAELKSRVAGVDSYSLVEELYERASHMDRINQALFIDTTLLLPGNNLVKPDRMGMSVSLEARAPFMDYRMVELAFRMPGEIKIRNGESKYIFKRAVEDLIGTDLAYRKKQMFTVPVGEWFKDELSGYCDDLLLSSRSTGRGLFDPAHVRSMLDEHKSGDANHTREIRALLAIEIWSRIFIDNELPAGIDEADCGVCSV